MSKNPDSTPESTSVGTAQADEDGKFEIHIDTEGIKKDLVESVRGILETDKLVKDEDGKGVVEPSVREAYVQELKERAERFRAGEIRQKWSYPVPGLQKFEDMTKEEYMGTVLKAGTTKEISANLRDFCFVSTILKGDQGDTVSIPYVKRFD